MKKTRFASVLFVFIIGFFIQSVTMQASPLQSPKSGWKVLGITTVKAGLDRDEVKVKIGQGQLGSLKIKVKGAPIEMRRIQVYFRNGEKQEIKTRKNFTKGSESRAMDLKGDKRLIKKVVFWYNKKKLSGKKPVVVLLGKE